MVRPMSEPERPRFRVACSEKTGMTAAELRAIARWIDAVPHRRRPWPKDAPVIVFNVEQVRLFAPGCKPTAWHPGTAYRRLRLVHREGATDGLVRALDLAAGETVLDCTLGLGHDAVMLADAGATVIGLERVPALLFFTLQGLWHYRPDLARRIHGRCVDHAVALADAPADSADHVYFDPMFPADFVGESTTWATWRAVTDVGDAGARMPPDLLHAARRVARRSVALKLGQREDPPEIAGVPPARVDGTARVRYAIWPAL